MFALPFRLVALFLPLGALETVGRVFGARDTLPTGVAFAALAFGVGDARDHRGGGVA